MSPPDEFDDIPDPQETRPSRWRYTGIGLSWHWLFVVLLLWGGFKWINEPAKFHDEYQGMPEAAVVAKLGNPDRDSRRFQQGAVNQNGEFELFWHYGFQQGLTLEFNNGVVVKQSNAGR